MQTAFVLGAGLGTRLRPLTEHLPKPLVPFGGRPLITYAFDHLLAAGIDRLIVNTHHCPETYQSAFPDASYKGRRIDFVYEPDLLETGGGIANISHLVPRGEGLVVYNGDILTDLPLTPALESHASTHSLATLVVRRDHPEKRISLDESSGSIVDIRGQLATGYPKDFGFTGIYCLSPEFLALLPPVSKYSVVAVFLDLIRSGRRVTGVPCDAGSWADLGDRSAYLDASAKRFPLPYIDPKATVDPSSTVAGTSYIDAGATVGAGATVVDSVLWPNATVAPESSLTRCIVRNGELASGIVENQDF